MNLSFWKDRSVLLTGHTGFKGAWTAFLLDSLGARVTGVALEPTPEQPLLRKFHLQERIDHHVSDILNRDKLATIVTKAEPDVVIHMAAQSLVRESYQSPVETFETNVVGTANLLDCLRSASHKNSVAVVVVTTDKCYQNNELGVPFSEVDPLGGQDPYSSSKACTELVVQSYRDSFFSTNDCVISVATGRAGNVIGGGDGSRDRLIPDAMRAFSGGRILHLRNPHSVRPWQHVLEPISGYLTLAEHLYSKGNRFDGGWNFGPAEESTVTVGEVVMKVADLYGEGAGFTSVDLENQPHEATLLRLDITKAEEELNWKPRWPLDVSLAKTVDWYKQDLEGADMRRVTRDQISEYLKAASLGTKDQLEN